MVRAFEDEHEDYPLAADTLGVNRSTGRGIIWQNMSGKDEYMKGHVLVVTTFKRIKKRRSA